MILLVVELPGVDNVDHVLNVQEVPVPWPSHCTCCPSHLTVVEGAPSSSIPWGSYLRNPSGSNHTLGLAAGYGPALIRTTLRRPCLVRLHHTSPVPSDLSPMSRSPHLSQCSTRREGIGVAVVGASVPMASRNEAHTKNSPRYDLQKTSGWIARHHYVGVAANYMLER